MEGRPRETGYTCRSETHQSKKTLGHVGLVAKDINKQALAMADCADCAAWEIWESEGLGLESAATKLNADLWVSASTFELGDGLSILGAGGWISEKRLLVQGGSAECVSQDGTAFRRLFLAPCLLGSVCRPSGHR